MAAVAGSDIAEVEKAVYDESFRTLKEQAALLDGLRARAGAVAAVANIATAFVGGLALSRGATDNLGGLEWTAVGFFCAALGISLLILVPSRNWVFWHHPHKLLSVYLDPGPPTSLSEFRRTIAYYNGSNYDANGRRLRVLSALLSAATISLAIEVVLWLVVLAT